jgi:hypothetical protein
MLFVDAKAQVLRRLGRTSPSALEDTALSVLESAPASSLDLAMGCWTVAQSAQLVDLQYSCTEYEQVPMLQAPSVSGMRHDHFIVYLVANIGGPMEAICRSQLAPTFQADSPEQMARKQSFLALAATFYGLAHSQPSLVYYGRRQYLQALHLVNTNIGRCRSTAVAETISSIVALCLHEVNSSQHSPYAPD